MLQPHLFHRLSQPLLLPQRAATCLTGLQTQQVFPRLCLVHRFRPRQRNGDAASIVMIGSHAASVPAALHGGPCAPRQRNGDAASIVMIGPHAAPVPAALHGGPCAPAPTVPPSEPATSPPPAGGRVSHWPPNATVPSSSVPGSPLPSSLAPPASCLPVPPRASPLTLASVHPPSFGAAAATGSPNTNPRPVSPPPPSGRCVPRTDSPLARAIRTAPESS